MSKLEKFSIIWIILMFLCISVTVLQAKVNTDARMALIKEVKLSRAQKNKKIAEFEKKEKAVNRTVLVRADSSNDPVLKSVAQQNINYKKVTNIANSFFKKYYTWTNSDEYNARAKELANIITPELAKNKDLFKDVKDVTGDDYVKTSGLQSRFEKAEAYLTQSSNDGKVQALVKVTNSGWTKGQEDESGLATNWYDLTLDLKTNKISNLKLVLQQRVEDDDE